MNGRAAMTIDDAIFSMAHDSKKVGIQDAAIALGMSPSMLYRKVSPTDEGAYVTARELPKMMETFGSWIPLRVLNRKSGFIAIRPPRGKPANQSLVEYHEEFLTLLKFLIRFFNRPTTQDYIHVFNLLTDHLESTQGMKIRVQKNVNQMELKLAV